MNLLLYSLTQEEQYKRAFTTHMDGWATADPIPRTPAGLSYVSQWGSLRVAGTGRFFKKTPFFPPPLSLFRAIFGVARS